MVRRLLFLVAFVLMGWHGVAWAQVGCAPNPNLNGQPFVDGCPIPAAGLNKIPTIPVNLVDSKSVPITPALATPSFAVSSVPGTTGTQISEWLLCNCATPQTYDVIQGAASVPLNSTVTVGNGVAGWAITDTGNGNSVGVGVMGGGLADSDGSVVWGSNFLVGTNRGHVTSTHGTRTAYATELDCDTTATTDVCTAAFIEGNATVQPASASAVNIGYLDFVNGGSVAKWNYGIFLTPGSSTTGILIGQADKSAPSGDTSMPLTFAAFNGGGAGITSTITLQSNGLLLLNSETQVVGLLSRTNANKDLLLGPNVDLPTGTAIESLNDAQNAFTDLEIIGDTVNLRGNTSVTINAVFNLNAVSGAGAAAKYVCTDSAGNVLIQAGAC